MLTASVQEVIHFMAHVNVTVVVEAQSEIYTILYRTKSDIINRRGVSYFNTD